MRSWRGAFTINGEDDSYIRWELSRSPTAAAFGVDPADVTNLMPRDAFRFESRVYEALERIAGYRTGGLVVDEIVRRNGRISVLPAARAEESGAASLGGAQVGIGFRAIRAGAASTPETILFHELVHALRAVAGATSRQATHDDFENLEEFYAILLEDYFSSERGGRLRHAHHSRPSAYYPANVPSQEPTGMTFHLIPLIGVTVPVTTYSRTIPYGEFTIAHRDDILAMRDPSTGFGPSVFDYLADIRTPFNPIRDVLWLESSQRRDTLVPPPAMQRGRQPAGGGAFRLPPVLF